MPNSRGYTREEILSRRFPAISRQLAAELERVPPSNDRGPLYHPCVVTLRDGATRDFVYLCESQQWLQAWGLLPDEPLGKRFIDIGDIVTLRESPNRLPLDLANKLYVAGETGMGYMIFTACFDDGSTAAFVTGNAVDFIRYPSGKSRSNLIDVLPHVGRDNAALSQAPSHYWSIFERAG